MHLPLAILLILIICVTSSQNVYRYLIFTEDCWNNYTVHFNFLNIGCLKTTGIKMMSYLLVLGGLIVKLPQIFKIINQRSVFAISFLSVLSQTSGGMSNIAYNVSQGTLFSIYGENIFIVSSNILIMCLFIIYSKQFKGGFYLTLVVMSIFTWLIYHPQYLPSIFLDHAIFIQSICFSTSRLLQIFLICRYKSTGTLSFLTCLMNSMGNFARFITICVDADKDWKLKINVIIAFILNGIILVEFYLYRNNAHPKEQNKTRRKQN